MMSALDIQLSPDDLKRLSQESEQNYYHWDEVAKNQPRVLTPEQAIAADRAYQEANAPRVLSPEEALASLDNPLTTFGKSVLNPALQSAQKILGSFGGESDESSRLSILSPDVLSNLVPEQKPGLPINESDSWLQAGARVLGGTAETIGEVMLIAPRLPAAMPGILKSAATFAIQGQLHDGNIARDALLGGAFGALSAIPAKTVLQNMAKIGVEAGAGAGLTYDPNKGNLEEAAVAALTFGALGSIHALGEAKERRLKAAFEQAKTGEDVANAVNDIAPELNTKAGEESPGERLQREANARFGTGPILQEQPNAAGNGPLQQLPDATSTASEAPSPAPGQAAPQESGTQGTEAQAPQTEVAADQTAEGVKQPWEMTRGEYLDRAWIERSKKNFPYSTIPHESRSEFEKISPEAIKQFNREMAPAHAFAVQDAIDSGFDVPSEVLAEYPELKPELGAEMIRKPGTLPEQEANLKIGDSVESNAYPPIPGGIITKIKGDKATVFTKSTYDPIERDVPLSTLYKSKRDYSLYNRGNPKPFLQEQPKLGAEMLRPKPEKLSGEDKPKILQYLNEKSNDARKRLAAKLSGGSLFANPLDPEILSDLAIVGAHHIANGAYNLASFTKRMVQDYGEKIKDHIDAVWAAAKTEYAKTRNMKWKDAPEASVSEMYPDAPRGQPEQVKEYVDQANVSAKAAKQAHAEAVKANLPDVLVDMSPKDMAQYAQDILIGKEGMGGRARLKAQLEDSMREAINAIDKFTPAQQLQQQLELDEQKMDLNTPLGSMLDEQRSIGRKLWNLLGQERDVQQSFIENYLARYFDKPDLAKVLLEKLYKKYGGVASFLKQRKMLPLREMLWNEDGTETGLRLRDTNVLRAELRKNNEMADYLYAVKSVKEFQKENIPKYVPANESPVAGYSIPQAKDQPFFRVMDKDGRIVGYWSFPEPISKSLDAMLSKGLESKLWYKGWQRLNAPIVALHLAWSGFHELSTSLSTLGYGIGRPIKDLLTGDFKKAVEGAVGTVKSQYDLRKLGYQARADYLKPDEAIPTAERRENVRLLELAGQRRAPGLLERGGEKSPLAKVMDAIQELRQPERKGKILSGGKLAFNSIPAVLELSLRPIMIDANAQKLGATIDMIRRAVDRLGPDASDADIRREAAKASANADNAWGQMVHDNRFVNKMWKDIQFGLFQSFGWRWGTARMFGGAGVDTAKAMLGKSEGPWISDRMAHVIGYTAGTMALGAIYQYMHTGQLPQELKDYFFPKNGEKNPDGTEARVSLPGMLRDVFSYAKHPLSTLGHGLKPSVTMATDMWNNQDFFGRQIWDPRDGYIQKLEDVMKYGIRQLEPYSVSNLQRRREEGAGLGGMAESFMGITPAPASINRTRAQQTALDIQKEAMPPSRTQEQAQKSEERGKLKLEAKTDRDAAIKQMDEQIAAGTMTERQKKDILKRSGEDWFVEHTKSMSIEDAMRVWADAADAEKTPAFRKFIGEKLGRALKERPKTEAERIKAMADSLGISPVYKIQKKR